MKLLGNMMKLLCFWLFCRDIISIRSRLNFVRWYGFRLRDGLNLNFISINLSFGIFNYIIAIQRLTVNQMVLVLSSDAPLHKRRHAHNQTPTPCVPGNTSCVAVLLYYNNYKKRFCLHIVCIYCYTHNNKTVKCQFFRVYLCNIVA